MSEEEQIILPERYKRVEYIESTGTQYINTNYIPNAETGFCVDAQNITGGDQTPMGSGPRNANSIDCLRVPITTNNSVGAQWGTWQSWANNTTLAGNRFIGKTNFLNDLTLSYYIDETLNASKALPAFTGTPTVPVYVFGTSNANNNGVTYAWKGRIYDAKISQGTEVIKHFIPIYDTQRSTYCMYETIEGKVYYNQGSGAFGSSLKEDALYGVTNKLPEGFKRVEYLLSPGLGAYIDTGYVPTNETGYYVEAQAFKNESSYVFGSNETTNWNDNKRIYFMLGNSTTWGWMTYGTLTSAGANLRHPTLCDFNFLNSRKVVTTINNTDFTYELPDLNFTPTRSIYLFTINLADTPYTSGYHDGTISRFKISEGTEIVRDFIPCLDPDGWPCMYELMEGKAYYNQGASSFGYPRDYKENTPYELPAGYKKCVYLQSNGTQWINTDHIPDGETGLYLKAQHLNYGDFINFGTWENSNVYFYAPRFNTSSKWAYWSFGTTYQYAFYYDKGDDLIYTSTMNLYNDQTVNMWSEDTDYHGYITFAPKTMTRPLWLFSYNMDNTAINTTYGAFGGRIFRAKITQGTSLIHDYVPCLDDSGRPCMYDLIDHVPLYNQSGGAEFAYCLEHQLPSDFLKLKYLESTGTQIIKTGIIPTDLTGIYVDAYHTKYNGDTDWSVIGLRNTNGNTYFTVGRVQRDTNGAGFGWGAFTTPGGTGNVRYEASLNFLNNRQSIITAPSFAQRINALGTLSFTPTKDLYMFGMNNYDGAAILYSTYRIYRAKISEGSEIVRDWVPAYDTRRSKPCMYDLINNVAYYNDGAGDFDYNKDFEGTYKGFALLSGIGNRLGYGEPFRGNESSGGEDISKITFTDTVPLLMKSGTGANSIGEGNEVIDTEIPLQEGYSVEFTVNYVIFFETHNSIEIMRINTSALNGYFIMTSMGIQKTDDVYIHGTTNGQNVVKVKFGKTACTITGSGYNGDDNTGITITVAGEIMDKDYKGLSFSPAPNVEQSSDTYVNFDGVKIYDANDILIADCRPANHEDGRIGMFCVVRNKFLPIQILEFGV